MRDGPTWSLGRNPGDRRRRPQRADDPAAGRARDGARAERADRLVTHAGARTKVYSASFSPDGTAITLGMTGVNGQADVYTIGIDGMGLTPVTRSPAWD